VPLVAQVPHYGARESGERGRKKRHDRPSSGEITGKEDAIDTRTGHLRFDTDRWPNVWWP
jgi:hypothetical protein